MLALRQLGNEVAGIAQRDQSRHREGAGSDRRMRDASLCLAFLLALRGGARGRRLMASHHDAAQRTRLRGFI
jgi:hypothetical protein